MKGISGGSGRVRGRGGREAVFQGVPGGSTVSEGFENIVWHLKDLMETSDPL